MRKAALNIVAALIVVGLIRAVASPALTQDEPPRVSEPLEASASDFAYPKTTGERPANIEENARYFAALDSLVGEDIEVHRLVSDVFNLIKPLSVLSEEPLRSRVLARQNRL